MHADRVLGDGSWTRGKRPKAQMALVTNKRVSTGSNSQLERTARQEMAVQYSCFSHRVRTFSSARSGSAQRRRCETADLSPWSSIQIPAWPVLQTRPKSRSEFHRRINNVSSREVSRDRQTLRRLLSCLPASKPDSRFVLSASPCRPPREPDCSSHTALSLRDSRPPN